MSLLPRRELLAQTYLLVLGGILAALGVASLTFFVLSTLGSVRPPVQLPDSGALCLALGASVLAHLAGRRDVLRICALLGLTVGVYTLAHNLIVGGADNGLSLLSGMPRVRTPFALAVVVGLLFIWLRDGGREHGPDRLSRWIGAGFVLFGLVAVLALWVPFDAVPRPGYRTTAALSAGLTTALIGLAIWCLSVPARHAPPLTRSAVLVAILGVLVTVAGYHLLTQQADIVTMVTAQHGLERAAERVERAVRTHRQLLDRMGGRWQASGILPDERLWLQETRSYLRDESGFRLIAVLGAGGRVLHLEPGDGNSVALLERFLTRAESKTWLESLDNGVSALGPVVFVDQAVGPLIPLGLVLDLPERQPLVLFALLTAGAALEFANGEIDDLYLELSDGERTLFVSGAGLVPAHEAWKASMDLDLWPGVTWRLSAQPGRWAKPAGFALLAPGLLLAGLCFTLFVVLNQRLAAMAGERALALRAREQYLEGQRDLLAMIAMDRPLDGILVATAAAISDHMGGARCLVALADDSGRRIERSFLKADPLAPRAQGLESATSGRSGSTDPVPASTTEGLAPEVVGWIDQTAPDRVLLLRGERGALLGVLAVDQAVGRPFDDADATYLQSYAHLATIAIERDHQRRRLGESEQRFKSLFLFNPDPVFALDQHGRFQQMNSAGLKLLGVAEDDLRGRSYVPLVVEEDRSRVEAHLSAAFDGAPQRYGLSIHTPSGGVAVLDVTNLPIRVADRVVGVFGIAKDVGERQRTLERLEVALSGERHKTGQLEGLAAVAVSAVQRTELSALFEFLVERARELIGAHQCVLGLTLDRSWAQSVSAFSLSDKYAKWRGYAAAPDGSGIYRLVCANNQPICLTQAELEAHPAWRGFGAHAAAHPPMRGWLAVPLTNHAGANVGLLQLSDKFSGEFDSADLAVAQQFAQIASAAIENRQLVDKLLSAERRVQSQLDFTMAITHALAEGVVAVDAGHRVSFVNPKACHLLGADESLLMGAPIADVLPAKVDVEALLLTPEGGAQSLVVHGGRPLSLSCSRLDSPGDRAGWVVGVRDLTAEQGAEQMRRERDQFFDLSLDMFCMVSLDGRFLQTNRAFVETLHYRPGALDGRLYMDLIHAADHDRVVEAVSALEWGEQVRDLSIRVSDAEGEEHVLEINAAFGPDKVIYCVARDITAHRKARLALERSEAKLRITLESITDAFFVLDETWHFTYMNREAGRVLDVDPDGMVGTCVWDSFPGSFESEIGQQYRKARDTGLATHFESFYEPHRRWFEVHAYPSDESLAVYFRDVTERVRTNEKLHEMMVELERSNHELNSFAYVASHDLQEPLRKIRVFSERLQSRGGSLDSTGRDYLDRISGSAQRMQELIVGLLDYSRASTKPPTRQTFSLQSVLDAVCADLETRIEETGARIETVGLPMLVGDPVAFRQIMQNLIANGLKFRSGERQPVVKVCAAYDGGKSWTLSVEDNGIGFDPKHVDRVFQPFQRLHDRGEYAGSGIGLSVVKRIVKRNGGEISVSTTPGIGTVFRLSLPSAMLVGAGVAVAP